MKQKNLRLIFLLNLTSLPLFSLVSCNETSNPKVASNLLVVGDSLSDTGNGSLGGHTDWLKSKNNNDNISFELKPPFYNQSWSNGPVAAEVVAQKLGHQLTPAWSFDLNNTHFSQRGNNYAFGGGVIQGEKQFNTFNFNNQVQMLLQQHKLSPVDVIFITIGSNDVAGLLFKQIEEAQTQIKTIINLKVQGINQLIAQGAHQIILSDIPDLTITPKMNKILKDTNVKAHALAVVNYYQTLWKQTMKQFNPTIVKPYFLSQRLLDLQTEFKQLFPAGNIVDSATITKTVNDSTKPAAIIYQPQYQKGVSKANEDNYFFFDEFHPNKWVHSRVAEDIYQMIT